MNTLKLSLFTAFLFILNSSYWSQTSVFDFKATIDGWEVRLDSAYKLSNETGKPILANFTGSDWCGWCMRLKRDVFITDEFKEWAEKNVVLLELDYPKHKAVPLEIQKQNAGLAQAFGVRGYPTIWVFSISTNPETRESAIQGLAKTGYVAGGAKAWIKDLESKMAQK